MVSEYYFNRRRRHYRPRRFNPEARRCPVIKAWDYEVLGESNPCGALLRPGKDYCGFHQSEYSRRYGTAPPPKNWIRKVKSDRCQFPGCNNVQKHKLYPHLSKLGQFCHYHSQECIVPGCPEKPASGRDPFCLGHRASFNKGDLYKRGNCSLCRSTRHGYNDNDEACIRALQKNTGLTLEEISEESGIPLRALPTEENYDEYRKGDGPRPLELGNKNYQQQWLIYVWHKMGNQELLDFYGFSAPKQARKKARRKKVRRKGPGRKGPRNNKLTMLEKAATWLQGWGYYPVKIVWQWKSRSHDIEAYKDGKLYRFYVFRTRRIDKYWQAQISGKDICQIRTWPRVKAIFYVPEKGFFSISHREFKQQCDKASFNLTSVLDTSADNLPREGFFPR